METPNETVEARPFKDQSENLNSQLWAKADAELKAIIERHINLNGLVSDTGPLRAGAWVHVINLRINGAGVMKDMWAPSLIEASKEAAFLALRDYYRNRYVSTFINKIATMQQELEELQQRVS